jgi:alpha-galactosidase
MLGAGNGKASALDNGLALTPPMGWSSWNHFGKGGFSETTIYEIIDAIVSSGMRDAGYTYVVVSGGWRDNHLAPDGKLLPHPTRFPNGIKPLADYAHANGLKIGIHTCPGETDCGWDPVGGIGREALHVSQFVEWEVDYVMLDNCYMDWKIMEEKFKLWRDLFAASGRDILYKPTFPIWAPVTTTGTLLSIVETHTDEFKTGFAVMAAP